MLLWPSELGKGLGATAVANKGTYLELGAGPNWPMGTATLAIPVSVGLSLKDYYEDAGRRREVRLLRYRRADHGSA